MLLQSDVGIFEIIKQFLVFCGKDQYSKIAYLCFARATAIIYKIVLVCLFKF